MSDSVQPHRRQPTRLSCPWDSPGNTGVGCHVLLQCMKVKSESEVSQLCLTLRDPMDCSPPGSSVHGIFQARVLEWGAIAFSDALMWEDHKGSCVGQLFWATQITIEMIFFGWFWKLYTSLHPSINLHFTISNNTTENMAWGKDAYYFL